MPSAESNHAPAAQPNERHTLLVPLVIFALFAAALIAASTAYYRSQERQLRSEVEAQLSAIADLKTRQLVEWRSSHFKTAALFYRNPLFTALAHRLFASPQDEEARQMLTTWLAPLAESDQYEAVFLVDASARTILALPQDANPLSRVIVEEDIPRTLQNGQVELVDFHRDRVSYRIYLEVLIPILPPEQNPPAAGVLVLRIDPAEYLYPFIQRWPVPSASAETLLIRNEGGSALFLNELRFIKGTALNLSIPPQHSNVVAVMAISGKEGFVEGLDYRGVPVLADVRPVPDSPWYLVARRDIAEVLQPLQQVQWGMLALNVALLLAAAATLGYLWRQRNERYLRQLVQVSDALRISEQRFRSLFESMSDGAALHEIVYDASGAAVDYRILDANPAFERHTGIAIEAIRGRLATQVYGAPAAPYLQQYAAVAEGGEPYTFETFFPPMHRHFRITAFSPRRGQFATLFSDITERVRRDQELRQKNEELQRFTYTISHDLKSPLVTIQTFLGYLEEDIACANSERCRQDMGYIRDAAERMARLLNELLEMSRIGRITNPPVRVGFQKLVEEVLRLTAGQIAQRGAVVEVPPQDILLTGDRPRLVQIWQNLVDNAVKFSGDQPAPRIVIGFERQGEQVVFFVRDNGIGIDPHYHDRVFGLFDKLDPQSQGTGIGLALAKRIVELYNGTIWVESEGSGKGTCFHFTLPDAVSPANHIPKQGESIDPDTQR